MRTIFELLRQKPLERLFPSEDANTVNRWFSAMGRAKSPVVLVGAGFSRNAHGGEHVMLWSDVNEILARLAGVDPAAHDSLTLADYAWSDNALACIRLLQEGMPDDELLPNKAHAALFGADIAAIVTTNNLDTLLDKAPLPRAFRRVYRDTDIALADGRPPLIYFHGHRDLPDGWVFTRSQFEDVARTKPLIYAKVRQLLAEHPVVTVGFSLADPNFHNVYRNIVRDLGGLSEQGLALLLSTPSAAERNHWAKFGLKLVTFRPDAFNGDPDEQLAEFFTLLSDPLDDRPTNEEPSAQQQFNYEGGRSPRDPSSSAEVTTEESSSTMESVHDRVVEIIEQQPTFARRLQLRAQYLDSQAEKFPEEQIPFEKFRTLWLACLRPQLTSEERSILDGGVAPDEAGVTRLLDYLPSPRFAAPDASALVRAIDGYVARLSATTVTKPTPELRLLVEWLRAGVDGSRDQPYGNAEVLLSLACYLQADLASFDPSDTTARQGLIECYALAKKLDLADGSPGFDFEADLAAAGLTRKVLDAEVSPFVKEMESAFIALQNGENFEAEARYERALSLAQGDAFREWVAAEGRAQAIHLRVWYTPGVVESDSKYRQARKSAKEARKQPEVRSWISIAEARRVELDRTMIRELKEELDVARGETMSNTRYWVWRSFRELEEVWAPPHLQQRELEPLLSWGRPLDDGQALSYRIRLSMRARDTKDELRRLANTLEEREASPSRRVGQVTFERRDARNATLVTAGTTPQGARRARYSQLQILPNLVQFARLGDEETLRQLIVDRFGEVREGTFRSLELTRAGYITACFRATDALFRVGTLEGVNPLIERYAEQLAGSVTLASHANPARWGWARWGLVDPQSALDVWVKLQAPFNGPVPPSIWPDLAHALAVIRDNVSDESVLTAEITRRGEAWLEMVPQDQGRWVRSTSRFLRTALAPTSSAILEADIAGKLEDIVAAPLTAERIQQIAEDIEDFGMLRTGTSVDQVAVRWFERFADSGYALTVQETLFGRMGRFPTAIAHALGQAIIAQPVASYDHRPRVAAYLIELLQEHPTTLAALPRHCLQRELWGLQWPSLIGAIRRTSLRQNDWQSLLRGLTNLHRGRSGPEDIPAPGVVQPLRELPLLCVQAEDGETARSAVQALGFMAQTPIYSSDEVLAALEAAAKDPRVKVRASLAYAAARLARFATEEAVKSLAASLNHTLSQSEYLDVRYGHEIGSNEPRFFTTP